MSKFIKNFLEMFKFEGKDPHERSVKLFGIVYFFIVIIIAFWVMPKIADIFGIDELPSGPIFVCVMVGFVIPRIFNIISKFVLIWTEEILTGQKRIIIDMNNYRSLAKYRQLEQIAADHKEQYPHKKVLFTNFDPNEIFQKSEENTPEKAVFLFEQSGWDITFYRIY